MGITAELYEFIVRVVEDKVREIRVTREEFNKLRETVDRLAKSIERLSEAQRRTEEAVKTLAEAQKRTEERLNALAEAQKRTEDALARLSKRVDELAEAQKRTEDALARLSKRVESLGREVGRLSSVVGFTLEDLARLYLPYRLRRFGYEVTRVEKRWFMINRRRVQVDLYGEGVFKGRRIVIIGECSSVVYKRDVKRVWRVARKVSELLGVEAVPIVFGFIIHPSGRDEAEKLNVIVETAYKP